MAWNSRLGISEVIGIAGFYPQQCQIASWLSVTDMPWQQFGAP